MMQISILALGNHFFFFLNHVLLAIIKQSLQI